METMPLTSDPRALRPPSSSRDVSARTILARLRPRTLEPALGPLRPRELAVLRCRGLDERLLEHVGTLAVPRDLLGTPGARARALVAVVPDGGVIIKDTAVWVHLGGEPPDTIHVAHPDRRGRTRTLTYSRMVIPPEEIEAVGGMPCATLARAVVDVARTAPPVRAVETVIRARDAGLTSNRLEVALLTCRGAAGRGGPRVRRIIDTVIPPRRAAEAQTCGRRAAAEVERRASKTPSMRRRDDSV